MMELPDLDEHVRALMLDEIRADFADGRLYLSPRLTAKGCADWPDLLANAAERGRPESLADELLRDGRMQRREMSQRNGRAYPRNVRRDAHETLAEGEFNRFYIRAVCLAALRAGQNQVIAYRAKRAARPRRESILLENTSVDAAALLTDLRNHQGIDTALGLPPGPNSGMSARLASQVGAER